MSNSLFIILYQWLYLSHRQCYLCGISMHVLVTPKYLTSIQIETLEVNVKIDIHKMIFLFLAIIM